MPFRDSRCSENDEEDDGNLEESGSEIDIRTARRIRKSLGRRAFLSFVGAAGTTALAGCSGDGDGATEDGSTPTPRRETVIVTQEGSEETVVKTRTVKVTEEETPTEPGEPIKEEFHWTQEDTLPSKAQYNPYNPSSGKVNVGSLRHDLVSLGIDGKFYGELVDDWTLDGDSLDVTLKEGYTWQASGNSVNAEDLLMKYRIEKFLGFGYWDFIDSIEQTGDYSLNMTLSKEWTPTLAIWNTLASQNISTIEVPTSFIEEFVTRMEDAESDDERENVQQDLTSTKIQDPQVVSNSAWKISDTGEGIYIYTPYEDHPNADNINFPRVVEHVRSGDLPRQRILSGDDDALTELQPQVRYQLPDKYEEIRVKSDGMPNIEFNLAKDEPYANVHVRRAIAYLSNNKQIAGQSALISPVEVYSGIVRKSTEEEILGDLVDGFTNYGWDTVMEEEAASELREAGYEKSGGTWRKDGEKLSITFQHFPFDESRVLANRGTINTMTDFGIEATTQQMDVGNLWNSMSSGEQGAVIGRQWGRFPITALNLQFQLGLTGYRTLNMPEEIEIPMPVGEPGGSLETVRPHDIADSFRTATDEDRARELLQQMSWIVNQYLPSIPQGRTVRGDIFNAEAWEAPRPDEAPWAYAENFPNDPLEKGLVRAKTE